MSAPDRSIVEAVTLRGDQDRDLDEHELVEMCVDIWRIAAPQSGTRAVHVPQPLPDKLDLRDSGDGVWFERGWGGVAADDRASTFGVELPSGVMLMASIEWPPEHPFSIVTDGRAEITFRAHGPSHADCAAAIAATILGAKKRGLAP